MRTMPTSRAKGLWSYYVFSCLGLIHTAFPYFSSLRTDLFWSCKLFLCFRIIMGAFRRERLDICFIGSMKATRKVLPKTRRYNAKHSSRQRSFISFTPRPLCRRGNRPDITHDVGWALQSVPLWQRENLSSLSAFETRYLGRPARSQYTNWATPAHFTP